MSWTRSDAQPRPPDGAGNQDWRNVRAPRKKKKRESTVIRFSDFDSQEAYAAALAAAAIPLTEVSATGTVPAEDDFEDDEDILFAIVRLYH